MPEMINKISETDEVKPSRPFILTILCLVSFVYFGIISLLFLLSVIFSGWITEVINKYTPENVFSQTIILLITAGGFLLHALSFTGTLMIWKMKKSGYYLFSVSALLIAIYHLINHKIPLSLTAAYIALIFLFGIFYRKLK
jgi:hypothetical protein